MALKKTNPDFLNGVPELLALQLLDRRPMHGYEVVQAIRLATDARLDFAEVCLYPVLHRLEAQGMSAAKREVVGGRSRVVYRLTPRGRRRLDESRTNRHSIAEAVRVVLQGSEHARPAPA